MRTKNSRDPAGILRGVLVVVVMALLLVSSAVIAWSWKVDDPMTKAQKAVWLFMAFPPMQAVATIYAYLVARKRKERSIAGDFIAVPAIILLLFAVAAFLYCLFRLKILVALLWATFFSLELIVYVICMVELEPRIFGHM